MRSGIRRIYRSAILVFRQEGQVSARLLSLLVSTAAILLLWAMPPRRRRRRRRVDLEAFRESASYGSSESREALRIAVAKVEAGEWISAPSQRRRRSRRGRGRRKSAARLWLVAMGVLLGITVVGGVLVSADVKPFSTYAERYLPSGRSQAPAPTPLPLTAHQTVANTPTPASTATPIPAVTLSSGQGLVALTTPTATLTPKPTRQTPRTRQSASAFWTPTPIPSPTLTPTPNPDPSQRHIELKRDMLNLVNENREWADAPPLVLGDNPAAQLHADESLANCMFGHWDAYGTKPYMRYSAVGGYQGNGENSLGSRYCPRPEERYVLTIPEKSVAGAVESWMNSPGHRRAMLDPAFKKLNIGLAWSDHSFFAYHHFEGDYVEFDALPAITSDGMLHFVGRTKNGARIEADDDVYVAIHYDPPLKRLTRGQLAQAHCYPNGARVASLRRPLTGGSSWTNESSEYELSSCLDPYGIDPDAPAPTSFREVDQIRAEAKAWSAQKEPETVLVPWITATVWKWEDSSFEVEANIGEVLREHGDGVYTVMINASVDGEPEWIAQYSIFRGVEPPDIYQLNTN